MKKSTAVLSAFLIGVNCFASGAAAMAEQNEDKDVRKPAGVESLLVPQKLEVVLDPWELGRKGQVYSEEYVIQNMGDTAGLLTLSDLACKPQDQGDVIVKTDKAGLHDNEEKSVYMELVFGNGERVVLSEESSKYEVRLQAGEGLSLCFTGEMNEYASQGWENGDVGVEVVYSWDIEEEEPETGGENVSQIDEGQMELEEGEFEEEEEPKIIYLEEFRTSEAVIDSWRVDEDGQMLSEEYIIRNTGESAGIFTFSKLVCRAGEESGILVKGEKEEIEETEERAVYVEMAFGNGERACLSDEKDYIVELRPGEEISVCFEGKMNWDGSLEEGDVIVSALCSWEVKEAADEQNNGMDKGLTDQKEDEGEDDGNV